MTSYVDPELAAEADRLIGVEGDGPSVRREHATLARLRSGLIRGEAIKELPKPEPLIEGVVDLDTLAVLYGRAGAGKSFVALDLALSVATGTWWHGRPVTPGPVLYVVAEGAAGTGARLGAWQTHQRVFAAGDITWLTAAPNLLRKDSIDALETITAELQPRLIIADTLARLIPGGDENSHQTMSTVVESADRLRRVSGACVFLVHHTGKDQSAGARGHTSLLGALDTEIACEGAERLITLRATKQKHHADGDVIARFRLLEVGDSCALALHTGSLEPDGALARSDQIALDALHRIAVPEGIPAGAWRESTDPELPKRTFWDARARLLQRGLITQPAKNRYLPSAGADASAGECDGTR